MYMNKLLLYAGLCLLSVGSTYRAEAQIEGRRHAVLLYPTRLLNEYFPAFTIGYLYQFDQNWVAGVSLGGVAEGGYIQGDKGFLNKKINSVRGYEIGLEARYSGFYAALEASRAFAYSRYGMTPPDINGVSRLVNARLVARRNEFSIGYITSWRFDFGLMIDARVGVGIAGHSWGLTDNSLTPATDAKFFDEFDEEVGAIGRNQTPNEVTLYPTVRARVGIGWQF